MKPKDFIDDEIKQYEELVIKHIKGEVDLEELYPAKLSHARKCEKFIYDLFDAGIFEGCNGMIMYANRQLEAIDKKYFGIYINGEFISYNFMKYNK